MNSSSVTVVRSLKPVAILFLSAIILVSISLIVQFGLVSRPTMAWLSRGLLLPDFFLHTVAFTSLAMPVFILLRPMVKTAVGIFVVGVGLELAQWVTKFGEASFIDVAANTTGIALAALVFVMLRRLDFVMLRPLLGRST